MVWLRAERTNSTLDHVQERGVEPGRGELIAARPVVVALGEAETVDPAEDRVVAGSVLETVADADAEVEAVAQSHLREGRGDHDLPAWAIEILDDPEEGVLDLGGREDEKGVLPGIRDDPALADEGGDLRGLVALVASSGLPGEGQLLGLLSTRSVRPVPADSKSMLRPSSEPDAPAAAAGLGEVFRDVRDVDGGWRT